MLGFCFRGKVISKYLTLKRYFSLENGCEAANFFSAVIKWAYIMGIKYMKKSAGALPKLPKPRRFHLAWSETGKPRRSSHFFLPVQPEVGAWILDIHDQIQYTLSIDIIKLCVVDHKAAFFWTSLLNWSNLLDGLFKTIASYFTNWSPHSIQA